MSSLPVKKRILFVDDEPSVLAALESLLYRERRCWEMVFVGSGARALAELRKQPFDVIVSDMRMPGIDGTMLLGTVRTEFPNIVRIMLTGTAERTAIARALPTVHQLLSKPCKADALKSAIASGIAAANGESDSTVRGAIGKLDKLPSPPRIFRELTALLESPTASVNDVARVVARDPALAAKVLQLVNSAYFGTGRSTGSIDHAVAMLGCDRLRYIALTVSVFSSLDGDLRPGLTMEAFQDQAQRAAVLTKAFLGPSERDDGFTAALLRDIGHVILAVGLPIEYRAAWTRAATAGERVDEREAFGTTHSEVGSCLLAMWGLPDAIIDTVRHHHDPGSALPPNRRLASAVHVAHSIVSNDPGEPIDEPSIDRAGCTPDLARWLLLVQTGSMAQ